nr:helix-turn-helix transcriptional regulator [uncultured Shimia sp.]
MTTERTTSRLVNVTLITLGAEICRARKARKYSQADLAERVGCSRNTLRAIETGSAKVDIGTFLEAAALVGIPLLGGDEEYIVKRGLSAFREAALLPQPRKKTLIDDDF